MAPQPRLLDAHGVPIPPERIARLRQPVAYPTPGGVRPPFSPHPADRLTPAGLAAILQSASLGQSMQYMQVLEDVEEREPHYLAVLSTRKRSVAQLPIRVAAAGEDAAAKEHAAFIQRWLDTGVLETALFDILDAVGKGFSVHEITWQTEPGETWPVNLRFVPQRWCEADYLGDGNTIMLRDTAGLRHLPPHKFLVHRHPAKSGLILRSGLGRVALWTWLFKQYTSQDWQVFIRNFGLPLRLGRYGLESSNEDREVLWRAVSSIAGDGAAIIPKSMEMEFVQLGDLKGGGELYEQRCRYLDEQLSKLVLGQTATTDAINGGHAVGKVHRQVEEDIEAADARQLGATLSRALVPQIIAFNFGPQRAFPRIEFGWPDEVPLAELIDAIDKLGPQGLRAKGSEVRGRLGLTEPGPEDTDLIGGMPAAAAPAPGAAASGGPAAPPSAEPSAAPAGPLRRLLSLHAAGAGQDAVEAMAGRLGLDAMGALSGLSDEVLRELEAASDLLDAGRRLATLRLDPAELGEIIGRWMAVANLVGRAEVLDELRG